MPAADGHTLSMTTARAPCPADFQECSDWDVPPRWSGPEYSRYTRSQSERCSSLSPVPDFSNGGNFLVDRAPIRCLLQTETHASSWSRRCRHANCADSPENCGYTRCPDP